MAIPTGTACPLTDSPTPTIETVDEETVDPGSVTNAKITEAKDDKLTQNWRTLDLATETTQTMLDEGTSVTQGSPDTMKVSTLKTVFNVFRPKFSNSQFLATAPVRPHGGNNHNRPKNDNHGNRTEEKPNVISNTKEDRMNKTEVTLVPKDNKVEDPPPRCKNWRNNSCLIGKKTHKTHCTWQWVMYQFSRLKAALNSTPVRGVIDLDPFVPPSFIHYINGDRQLWAKFTDNNTTFRYSCGAGGSALQVVTECPPCH